LGSDSAAGLGLESVEKEAIDNAAEPEGGLAVEVEDTILPVQDFLVVVVGDSMKDGSSALEAARRVAEHTAAELQNRMLILHLMKDHWVYLRFHLEELKIC
jgi:hypothetical protein